MSKTFKIVALIINGSIIACVLNFSYYYDNIFAIFFYLFFGAWGLGILFNAFFKEIEEYKQSKKPQSFIITFTGLFFISLIVSILLYQEIRENAPSLIKAKSLGVYADFKKNGNYIIKSGSWASKTHFHGTYVIKDSIITIDKKQLDEVLISNRFVIRKIENAYGENTIKDYLIQIDKKGSEINVRDEDWDGNFIGFIPADMFEITLDNR